MLIKQAAALEQARDIETLWAGVVDTLRTAGFSDVIYTTVKDGFVDPVLFNTVEGLYDGFSPEQDPFLIYACTSYDIMPLGAAFIDGHPYVTQAERAFVLRAAEKGANAAMAIPMRLQGSDRFGGFILCNGADRATFLERYMPRAEEFRLFCLLMHRRIEDLTQSTARTTTPAPNETGDFREPMIAPQLPPSFDLLTPREREVIYLIANGRSRQEAADLCQISVHTVSDYTKSAYKKLGVSNRGQVAALLRRATQSLLDQSRANP